MFLEILSWTRNGDPRRRNRRKGLKIPLDDLHKSNALRESNGAVPDGDVFEAKDLSTTKCIYTSGTIIGHL